MKIKLIVLLFCAFLSVNAFSQLKFGVTAGISSSTIKASDFITSDNKYLVETLGNSKVGLQGGLVAHIALGGFFIRPQMLLVYTGGEIQINDLVNKTKSVKTQHFTKLDIPVIVGSKIGPLRVGIGPVASIILSKPSDAWDVSYSNAKSKYNSATFGFQADAGLDILKFGFDVKYEGNLSKLGSGMDIGGHNYNFDSRNRQWIFAVSMYF